MRELILLCAMGILFVFGYFIMKKVDYFLENNSDRMSDSEDKK